MRKFTLPFVIAGVAAVAVSAFVPSAACAEVKPGDGGAKVPSLIRLGEVAGKTFNDHRSSFDARGAAFVTRQEGGVRVWDARTLKPLTELLAHPGAKAFVITGDGRTVLTRDEKEARLWDVATGAVRNVVRPERGNLEFAEISPDGLRVLTVSDAEPVVADVWRVGEAQPAKRLKHRGDGSGISAQFDPTGQRIVSYRESDGSFRAWRVDGNEDVRGWPFETNKQYYFPYVGKFDPRGGQFLIPKFEGFVIADCDAGGRSIASRYRNNCVYPHDIFFSADGSRISVAGWAGIEQECQIYSAETGKFQRSVAPGMTTCRLFGPGGRLAICDDYEPDRPAEVWDVDEGKLLQTIPVESPRDASPDCKTILFHTPDNRTSVWRLRD